jgi:uncharacterized phage protein (TIGR02218 family)
VIEIRRMDGEVLRFTDHNGTITYNGFDYIPTGGGSLTATRKNWGLDDAGADFIGVISSEAITYEDLYAGRYREAKVTTTTLEWRYPWAGKFLKSVHWVMETKFDGEQWTANMSTISGWLRFNVGDVHGRTCELTLYEPACGVSPGEYALGSSSMQVASIVTPRRIFTTADQSNSQSDGYFDGGHVIWITGPNEGVKSQIKVYTESIPTAAVQIELELETPFDITTNDHFGAWAGCNKIGVLGDCKLKFNNMLNFRGYETMPGTDRMVRTPTR